MNILLNGAEFEIDSDASLHDLVASLGRGTRGVAVAVNGEVVPASAWSSRRPSAGDRIEVLGAAQGG